MILLAKRRRSRSQRRWRRFLLCWSLALLLIGAAACFVLYQYLTVYEDTRPEAVMDAFLENNDAESLLLAARDNVRLNLTEFENEEELYASYLQTIDTGRALSYRSSLSESDDNHLASIVRSGAYNICTVVLTPQGRSPGFGRHYWTVSEIRSAPITDNLPSVSVQIETLADQPAYLNGTLISDNYLTDDSIPISNLNDLEARMEHPPTAVLYTVGPLYGEVKVTDADGRSISPDETSDTEVLRYHLTNGVNSLSIQAPEGITVSVNQVPLSSSDISSTSMGVVSDLPTYVTADEYRINSYHFEAATDTSSSARRMRRMPSIWNPLQISISARIFAIRPCAMTILYTGTCSIRLCPEPPSMIIFPPPETPCTGPAIPKIFRNSLLTISTRSTTSASFVR